MPEIKITYFQRGKSGLAADRKITNVLLLGVAGIYVAANNECGSQLTTANFTSISLKHALSGTKDMFRHSDEVIPASCN